MDNQSRGTNLPPPLLEGFNNFSYALGVVDDKERIGEGRPLTSFRLTDIDSFNFFQVGHGDYAETDVVAFGTTWDEFWLIEAWCDTTGWDCQAGGSIRVAKTFDDLVRYGMSKETRRMAGLLLQEEEE